MYSPEAAKLLHLSIIAKKHTLFSFNSNTIWFASLSSSSGISFSWVIDCRFLSVILSLLHPSLIHGCIYTCIYMYINRNVTKSITSNATRLWTRNVSVRLHTHNANTYIVNLSSHEFRIRNLSTSTRRGWSANMFNVSWFGRIEMAIEITSNINHSRRNTLRSVRWIINMSNQITISWTISYCQARRPCYWNA